MKKMLISALFILLCLTVFISCNDDVVREPLETTPESRKPYIKETDTVQYDYSKWYESPTTDVQTDIN